MPNPPLTLFVDIPDPMLYCFINSIFHNTPDGLMVDSNTATGSVICALVKVSRSKCTYTKTPDTISLILPASNFNRNLIGRFLYIDNDDIAKVLMILAREFKLIFSTYVYEALCAGLTKKQAVELFIEDYNLTDIPTTFETLTKRRQRTTKYAINNFNQKLRQMTYDTSKKVRKKIKNRL